MDRPPSVSASVSSTAHNQHKRSNSKALVDAKLNTSTVIPLFVRNLRLLNLDLLQDWPIITNTSFANQDARTRIRCAEWALYQLFRIYDPVTASDKLQPFFPPLEPLQSLNLRAALHRCLDGLKKNGVLGRETVLRKSMLDDCQGEKFWELCLAFSSIVLRAVNADRLEKPVAQRIGAAQGLKKSQRDSMLPLAIAHKAALSRLLSEKERRRQTYSRLFDVFADKECELHDRATQVKEQKRNRLETSELALDVLEKEWIGSTEIRSALLNGDEAAGADHLLTQPFEEVWTANKNNRQFARPKEEIGLLEDLESRTRLQSHRLQKWQNFQDKLISSRPPTAKSEAASIASKLRFDKHQNMTLRDMADEPHSASSPSRQHQKHDSVTKYDAILTAMREELRQKSAVEVPRSPKKRERERQQSYDSRRPNIASHGSYDGTYEQHQRAQSHTAVPFRPQFGKRMSSRSRSYQQPKVVSQLEPIPLKSEIFSPLKTQRHNSLSPASSGRMSVYASPIEGTLGARLDDVVEGATPLVRQDSSSSIGLGVNMGTPSKNGSGTSTPHSVRSSVGNHDSAVEFSSTVPILGSAGRNIDAMGRTMRPSLVDRTRESMASRSANDTDRTSQIATAAGVEQAETPIEIEPEGREQRLTLQERTRQSISLAPQTAPKVNKRASHARSRTSIFPVNQFETPPRRSTVSLAVQGEIPIQAHRNITPREKLFEQDAECASIFKPRPKVKLSPIASPSMVEWSPGHGIDMHEDIEADVAISSPLSGGNRDV